MEQNVFLEEGWTVKKLPMRKNAIATMNPAAARVSVVSALRTTSTAGNCRHVVSRIMLKSPMTDPLRNSLTWLQLAGFN